jgi:hypothetical protein
MTMAQGPAGFASGAGSIKRPLTLPSLDIVSLLQRTYFAKISMWSLAEDQHSIKLIESFIAAGKTAGIARFNRPTI